MANTILRLVPDARVAVGHGQMDGATLENVMLKFVEGEYDVLVSTNIIESGLDIPNANTIIINNAHFFGLSDLHQMRGRVGRSNRKAFCYILSPPLPTLTTDARKRMHTLEEFSELGDGFKVAMRDLDIRGAGDILGAEQSGFITDIGFDAYHKILDEAIQDLKEDEFKELFGLDGPDLKPLVQDCQIETDLEIIIPDQYVTNISERLSLYGQIDNVKTEDELNSFLSQLTDRFGPPPTQVLDLVKTVRLRWNAEKLGLEKLSIRDGHLKGTFDAANQDIFQSDQFGKLLTYVQAHAKRCRLKDAGKKLILTISNVGTVDDAIAMLGEMVG
jgi:transcription-repair coupling factor (superfamily II helicase)